MRMNELTERFFNHLTANPRPVTWWHDACLQVNLCSIVVCINQSIPSWQNKFVLWSNSYYCTMQMAYLATKPNQLFFGRYVGLLTIDSSVRHRWSQSHWLCSPVVFPRAMTYPAAMAPVDYRWTVSLRVTLCPSPADHTAHASCNGRSIQTVWADDSSFFNIRWADDTETLLLDYTLLLWLAR